MIKPIYITIFCCTIALFIQAQKPVIDSAVFGKWPSIEEPHISNDGMYSFYIVVDHATGQAALHIFSNVNDSNWSFKNVFYYEMTNNSRRILFISGEDSLGIFDTKCKRWTFIPSVKSFKVPMNNGSDCFAYLSNDHLRVEKDGQVYKFSAVADYLFSNDGKHLLFKSTQERNERKEESLTWVNLVSGQSHQIWSGIQAVKYKISSTSNQIDFLGRDDIENENTYKLYHYLDGMVKAIDLVRSDSLLKEWQLVLANNDVEISREGDKVLFEMKEKENVRQLKKQGDSNVIIWNYKEPHLQSEQGLASFKNGISKRYWAVVNTVTRKLVRLNVDEELLETPDSFENYLLFIDRSYSEEYQSLVEYRPSVYIISTDDGRKRFLTKKLGYDYISLSPDEKYALWFNHDSLSYFGYNTESGLRRNISKMIPSFLYDQEAYSSGQLYTPYDRPKWANYGHDVFLYGQYDIWRIDLAGDLAPENVTNHFGERQHIIFDLVPELDGKPVFFFNRSGGMLLTGFDPATKENGFWWSSLHKKDPVKCDMRNYAYFVGRTNDIGISERPACMYPLRAKDCDRFIVNRQSTTDYPNLYVTDDFKKFTAISNLHPEKLYNWIRAELVTWKMPDGRNSQGILYKPENFDPKKKYPLLFCYYEKWSSSLNEYLIPIWSGVRINIPYYVSNGYLVFTPDIYYKSGHRGLGVTNAVISAADYLGKLPWVDSSKMGIEGHSFAGWETNFLVTHSKKFAAACEADGISDEVSAYGEVNLAKGLEPSDYYETGGQASPYGYGVTPWTHPELYIENSPVFFVDRAMTPLLISHGDRDSGVPFSQALEMFLAMRRAGKRVWLLQYHNGGHTLHGDDTKDLVTRMRQFFDYYLKGMPPPRWMTVGVSAAMRGIDTGFELDKSGRQP